MTSRTYFYNEIEFFEIEENITQSENVKVKSLSKCLINNNV